MRNVLVMTAVGSVLALGSAAIAAQPVSLEGLVHKVQSGGDKGPGAGGQDGGKSSAPGSPGAGQGKGSSPGAGQGKGGGPEKGAGADKADRGAKTRTGEKGAGGGGKGTGGKQRATERGGRTGVDVDVRGGRAYRNGAGGRTRIDIEADRKRRARGRDVDVNVRGYGYGPSKGRVDCDQIVRRYSMCFRR